MNGLLCATEGHKKSSGGAGPVIGERNVSINGARQEKVSIYGW